MRLETPLSLTALNWGKALLIIQRCCLAVLNHVPQCCTASLSRGQASARLWECGCHTRCWKHVSGFDFRTPECRPLSQQAREAYPAQHLWRRGMRHQEETFFHSSGAAIQSRVQRGPPLTRLDVGICTALWLYVPVWVMPMCRATVPRLKRGKCREGAPKGRDMTG